ncbi:hypothetical protein K1T71_014641 [Dendrolimus kikuchii]|uniref:Uncharacterized protein n=1 Tax=Dendrolimus kikuchii TaxID=765133 RepID=A0ACC1CEW1_9NEOP|nr:hypothetical protein K1T71_014641 [Dendrolimus kikuchii]
MDMNLYIILLIINLGCVISELSLKFVFIIEVHEKDLTHKIGKALKATEENNSELKLKDSIILLDRENEEDAYGRRVPLIRTELGSQQLVKAIDDYLESRNATDAAIIVESEADVDKTLYKLLGNSNIRIWVNPGLSRDSSKMLKSMRPEPSFHVLVGESGFVMDTYTRAVKEKLVRRGRQPSEHAGPSNAVGADYLRTMWRKIRTQELLISVLQYITEVYLKLSSDLTFAIKINCDNLQSNDNMNSTKEVIYNQFAEDSESSNETLFFWEENRQTLYLRSRFILSIYKPDQGQEKIASWNADEDYSLLPGVTLEPLRMFFRIGTSAAVPWTMHKLDPNTGEQMFTEDGQPVYEGYCIDLIDKIAEALEFDYEIITPKSGGFGQKLPNGSWNGVVGDLMHGETDMAVAALTMTAEREEVIDFVAPYFEQTGILIVLRKPIRKTSLFKFMTVLRTEVWLSIVAALILTGFMIWLLEKYSPYSARNSPESYPYPCRDFTLKESFWFVLTSFTPQGGGEAPKALSGRTLVAAYWLFVVLMLATFTANLAAFLTVERMQTPVSSLEQLARQSRINYTVVEGSSIHQFFINMKFAEDTLYRVWKEITLNATSDQAQYRVWDYPIREQYGHILLAINASGPVVDAATGFQQVNEHTDADFAFIHDSAEIKYEVTRNCNLTEVGEVFAEQPYAIALARALLQLQKERFLEQLASKYWNETARQACPDADESEGITLESLGGVFIATLFGLGLAMITLAWEVFYYKRKERNKVQAIDATVEKSGFEGPKKLNLDERKLNIKEKLSKVSKLRRRDVGKRNVTFGDSFKPVAKKPAVSYISVFPRNEYRP